MNKMKIVITHEGTDYTGQIMRVSYTRLGYEDHGIFTASLGVEGDGIGTSVGGFVLDRPEKDSNGKFLGRVGTEYGHDYIIQILKTVGVESWENLVGKDIIVLYPYDDSGWGSMNIGFASLDGNRVFLPKEHAKKFLEED